MQAIFFLRHPNDIDHITPVIYRWVGSSERSAFIVLNGAYTAPSDFRIKFLQSLPRVKIVHISEIPGCIAPQYLLGSRDWLCQDEAPAVNRKSVEAIFDMAATFGKTGVVSFDWIYDSFQQLVSQVAHERGAKMVALPHGLSTFPNTNRMFAINDYDPTTRDPYCHPPVADKVFDYLTFPCDHIAVLCRPEFPKERIKSLGSARYAKEWIPVLKSFLPELNVNGAEGKKKVAFFLRSTSYPVFWEEVARTIEMICKFPDVCLVIQHHPRENDFHGNLLAEYPWFSKLDQTKFKIVTVNEVPSASLVQWADIVLDIATGMSFDAVYFNKPLLEIEYVFAYTATASDRLSGVRMMCRDDLVLSLERLLKGRLDSFYNEKERKAFLTEMLGDYEGDVLGRYVGLFEQCCGTITTHASAVSQIF